MQLYPLKHVLWRHIWKLTLDKIITNAVSVTLHALTQVLWGDIWKSWETFITASRHLEDMHKKRINEFKCKSCATLYPPWQMKQNKHFKTLLLYDYFVRFLVRVHKILKCFTRGKFLRESTIFWATKPSLAWGWRCNKRSHGCFANYLRSLSS